MGELRKLKRSLRDISVIDIIKSKIFNSPSTFNSHYCEPLSESINEFLDGNPEVVDIDACNMTLRDAKGKSLTFWVANYPYSYGSVDGHVCRYPSWSVVLRLRAIQLKHRDVVINNFIKSTCI